MRMYRGHPATLHGHWANQRHRSKKRSGSHSETLEGMVWKNGEEGQEEEAGAGSEGGVRVCWLPNTWEVATYRCPVAENHLGVDGKGTAPGGGWGGLLAAEVQNDRRARAVEASICHLMRGEWGGPKDDQNASISLQGVGGFIHNRCGAGLCHCIGRRGCVREVSGKSEGKAAVTGEPNYKTANDGMDHNPPAPGARPPARSLAHPTLHDSRANP